VRDRSLTSAVHPAESAGSRNARQCVALRCSLLSANHVLGPYILGDFSIAIRGLYNKRFLH